MNTYAGQEPVLTIIINMTSPDLDLGRGNGSVRFNNVATCDDQIQDAHKDFYETAQYVTGLIIYPALCILGITGNVLALVVLNHRDMATPTNVYLSALAVSDTFKLLNDLMYFIILVVLQSNPQTGQIMMSYVYPYAHYIFNMSVCVTAWLTISVAAERYICVCHPSKAKEVCTIPRAKLVCSAVFLFMSVLSIPSGFRYRVETIHDVRANVTCPQVVPTALGTNDAFMIPYSWIQNSLRGIIPVFVLVFMNARIINELRKERVKGKKFSARNRITLMLIVIIFMFLVCITPDAIMSTFFGKGYVEEDHLVKGIREITDSLLAVNSAFNFLLYCSMSQAFRNTFLKIFCPFRRDTSPERVPIARKVTNNEGGGGGCGGGGSAAQTNGHGCGGGDNKRETYV